MNISNISPGADLFKMSNQKNKINKDNQLKEKLNKAYENKDNTKLKEVCKEFEQYFMKEMLKSMKKTLTGNELIPKNKGEEIFSDMLDDEYSKKAANSGGIGLAKMLYEQLSKNIKIR